MILDVTGSPTFEQVAIILLLLGMMLVFAFDLFRIELVALMGLSIGYALGLVPVSNVFLGFSSPAVITVAEILLIVQALRRSRVVERLSIRLTRLLSGETSALAFLCTVAGFLSVFMNNIGALALILPVAISLGAKLEIPIQRVLMPISFATLLGGLCSLIGTPANLIVNQARTGAVGAPFGFFDFAWVGAPVAVVGIALLVFWSPRKLSIFHRNLTRDGGVGQRRLVTEVRVPADSPFVDGPVSHLEVSLDAWIYSIVRDDKYVFGRRGEQIVLADDILVIEVPIRTLDDACEVGIVESVDVPASGHPENTRRINVVLMPQSIFIGSRIGSLELLTSQGLVITGVVPQRRRIEGRLVDVQLAVGDILVLEGTDDGIDEILDESDLLRVSTPEAAPPTKSSYAAISVFSGGVVLAATGFLPPEIAFGLVVLILALTRTFQFREALHNLNWPILIMLSAMIPLGHAVATTGAAHMLSEAVLSIIPAERPIAVVASMLLIACIVTPFVNNVSTAVVLTPIAIEVAHTTSLPPEPLLIAVALGASLDFLTPFGHHNNTLVMGIAGYRFIEFPKLGAPLLFVAVTIGLLGISLFWL